MDKIKFLLFLILVSCTSTIQTNKNTTKDNILVLIKPNWTIDSLENTRIQLKKRNIDFSYNYFSHKNGLIDNISITVDCKDGFSGTSDTKKIEGRFGFYRNYEKKFKYQFAIGYIGRENEILK